MMWQFDNRAAPFQFMRGQGVEGGSRSCVLASMQVFIRCLSLPIDDKWILLVYGRWPIS